MLDNYNKQKESIIEAYNTLLSSSLLPIDNISQKDIQEQQEKLRDDQFVLCVAGQIKAGKSTLLNALIFKEEILPADDLPHTAKITAINYADDSYFTAYFYNQEEWNQLKRIPYKNDNGESIIGGYFKEYLEDEIELSIQKGIYESEIIGSIPKKVDDLAELKNYVAKDGTYTPFIKSVTIGYPSELLKNITIVDTPGTNDPNQFRSKMTEEWVHKADAVIYTTYAGRALDDTDIGFIDKYLIHVSASKRLIAVNKIDIIDDINEVIQWVESLKNDERYNKRIFGQGTTVEYISALGALISSIPDEVKLDETLSHYEEQLEENGYLLAKNHGVSKLKASIEKKLIENKGKNIIDGHKKYITTLFDRKIEKLQKELSESKSSLNTVLSDQDDLDKKESNIIRAREKVSSHFEDFKDQLRKKQDIFVNNFEGEILKVKNEIIDFIREELKKIRNTKHFTNEVQWIVKNNMEIQLNKFEKLGKYQERKFQEQLNESIESLIEEIDTFKAFNPEQLRNIVSFASSFESRNIRNSISEQFSGDNVNNVVEESANFLQRWLDTRGGLNNIRSGIMHQVNILLEKEFNINMVNNIRDSVKIGSDKLRANVEKEIKKSLSEMQEEIQEIKNHTGDKNELSQKHQKNIKTISQRISDFEADKTSFKDILNER